MRKKNMPFHTVFIGLIMAVLGLAILAEGAEEKTTTTKEEAAMVADGKSVKVNYTLSVEGKVIDSSKAGQPFEFTAGSKQVIPGFEKALQGMKVGDKKSFQVSPAEGYGQEDPRGVQEVPRDKLPPEIKPEPGMTLYTKGPEGQPIPVRIVEVKDDVVVMNFNHPLAGKTLNFDVEIIEIK